MSPPRADNSKNSSARNGVEALGDLNRAFEHRTRLAISVLLSRNTALNFRRLKELLCETDGSLGAHLKRLEEKSYVSVRKRFEERKPITWYSLTARGRTALKTHIRALDRLIRDAAQ